MIKLTTNKISRVCAVHDLSGFGRVSLTEVLPCLAVMGVEACPLPTAILSTHTYKFTGYSFLDLTTEMKNIINHWDSLNINFDAIYTGYLGSGEQIDILLGFIEKLKKKGTAVIVDPVLGDNILSDCRNLYSDRMNTILVGMKNMVKKADIITPNLTEATLLLNEEFEHYVDDGKLKNYLKRLSDMGPEKVAITSVMTDKNEMSVALYDRAEDKYYKIDCAFVKKLFHGTGDIFASIMTGAIVKGESFLNACLKASGFVKLAIEETLKHPELKTENGVCFEQILIKYFSEVQEMPSYKEI